MWLINLSMKCTIKECKRKVCTSHKVAINKPPVALGVLCYYPTLSSSGLNAASAPSSVWTPKLPQISSISTWAFGCSTVDAQISLAKPSICWGQMGSTAWTTRYWTSVSLCVCICVFLSMMCVKRSIAGTCTHRSLLGITSWICFMCPLRSFLFITRSGDDTADVCLCSRRWGSSPDVDRCWGQPWRGGRYALTFLLCGHVFFFKCCMLCKLIHLSRGEVVNVIYSCLRVWSWFVCVTLICSVPPGSTMLPKTPIRASRQSLLGSPHLRRAARTHLRSAGWKHIHTHVVATT